MIRRRYLACVAGVAAVLGAGLLAVPAAGARTAGAWGKAIEVPGLRALNKGGNAGVNVVSCTWAGNCTAGGTYTDSHRRGQGFVAREKNGRWGRAIMVPGLWALNKGGNAAVSSVSCAWAGNCAAAGTYTDGRGRQQGFVAVEKNGRWARAIMVPGLWTLNKGGNAQVESVSCGSAGNCAAAGTYSDHAGHPPGFLGFVVNERNGRWGPAIPVPGLAALNTADYAGANSVSCGSPGNCAAGGYYDLGDGKFEGFVVSEKGGVWGKAIEVPGLGTLNAAGYADVLSVSCAPAGNCAAGGNYGDTSRDGQAFVVSERNGRWGPAIEVPGFRALNMGGGAVRSVSCAPPGNCAAGGYYQDRHFHNQGFVVSRS